ncbi:alpha/beta fold hydrolase [Sinomicrobium weinanense]|uniref:Alpha/beta hydrolase n=1 Tax=Sinomicrobium weinanense TaxID=2842200 RepID=A0A926JNP1_9FLAO|nr:alpha/beta hydrolase [Sinomicrobium weinanense]MBC9794554.1 alpha/beta hydrolase [Sinomicrobium weinanense]MBU3124039.1 alpha/beta hydrolase [Sinomicrobium weinanense]
MTIDHKGIPVFYEERGRGPAVVLLHGLLESSRVWNGLVPELSRKNRVIAIDLLGHGQTGCLGYVHTMEMMAGAVEEVLKYLKVRRAVFIGHSMGGYVALAFAEEHPDTVKGLILLNSTARADDEMRRKNRDRAIAAVKKDHKSFIRMAITNIFRPKNRSIFRKEIKEIKTEALKTPLQGIVAALEGMKIRDDREVLLHFSPYRKMMIAGKKDPVLDFDTLMDQARGADITIFEIPDGHMGHIENKNEVLRAICWFLNK